MEAFSDGDLRCLVETPMIPWIYRLLGAKVGNNREISTMQGTSPDLISLGNQVMLADDVILGHPVQWRDAVYISRVSIGDEVFIGNSAEVTCDTAVVPNRSLIGTFTVCPAKLQEDTISFG